MLNNSESSSREGLWALQRPWNSPSGKKFVAARSWGGAGKMAFMCPRASQGTQWERSCQHSEHAFPLLQTNLRSLTLVPPVAFSAPFPFSSFSMGPHGDYPLQVFKRRWMGSQLSQKASSKGWESQSSVKLPTQGGLRILGQRERTVLLNHWTGTARSRAGTPARINSSVLVSEAAQFGKRCWPYFMHHQEILKTQYLSNDQGWLHEESVPCDLKPSQRPERTSMLQALLLTASKMLLTPPLIVKDGNSQYLPTGDWLYKRILSIS